MNFDDLDIKTAGRDLAYSFRGYQIILVNDQGFFNSEEGWIPFEGIKHHPETFEPYFDTKQIDDKALKISYLLGGGSWQTLESKKLFRKLNLDPVPRTSFVNFDSEETNALVINKFIGKNACKGAYKHKNGELYFFKSD